MYIYYIYVYCNCKCLSNVHYIEYTNYLLYMKCVYCIQYSVCTWYASFIDIILYVTPRAFQCTNTKHLLTALFLSPVAHGYILTSLSGTRMMITFISPFKVRCAYYIK